ADLVAPPAGRAEQKPAVRPGNSSFEVVQRPLVVGTGQDLQEAGVEGHPHAPRMRASTSSVARRQVAASGASRLSRSSGSVFHGRTLNQKSPQSTDRPSSVSRGASG